MGEDVDSIYKGERRDGHMRSCLSFPVTENEPQHPGIPAACGVRGCWSLGTPAVLSILRTPFLSFGQRALGPWSTRNRAQLPIVFLPPWLSYQPLWSLEVSEMVYSIKSTSFSLGSWRSTTRCRKRNGVTGSLEVHWAFQAVALCEHHARCCPRAQPTHLQDPQSWQDGVRW